MKRNLAIAQGGGPTAVLNASLAGVISEAKKHPEIETIYAAAGGIEGLIKGNLLDLSGMSEESIQRLKNTPGSSIGTCRYKVTERNHNAIIGVLRRNNIRHFLYNGGNDSMDTCHKVSKIAGDINVIGIPKTIDNDLAVTDHCPGYGSAARYAAVTTRELGLDIKALPIHVSVIEFMGRNTGWVTAASALAREKEGDAPHLIYFPERPFNEEQFLGDVKGKWDRQGGIVVAVSEGLAGEDGNMIVAPKDKAAVDGFGHILPGNVSQYLAQLITKKLGVRARSEKPGVIGRVSKAMCSAVDRDEAFVAGELGVRAAVEEKSGYMIGCRRISDDPYRIEFETIELSRVANVEKRLPGDFMNEAGNDVTGEFIRYCLPLLGGDLPDYFRFDG